MAVTATDRESALFLQWALPRLQLRWSGFLRVHKRASKRITRRLRELGLPDLGAYRRYLQDHDLEWDVLDGLCRIVVSRLYRDASVFDRLRDDVLPRLAAAARLANRSTVFAWSAGCACGEEPWTLRILWDRHVAPLAPDIALRVLATDADEQVLARARLAAYPPSSLRGAPPDWRTEAFRRTAGTFRLDDAYRHGVAFVRQDLRAAMPDGTFDLILCRNLAFTYFDEPLQRVVAAGLRARLGPGGEIVLGRHEHLPAMQEAD